MEEKSNIGIITVPINKSGLTPLSQLIDIVSSISKTTFLISGNRGYHKYKNSSNIKSIKIERSVFKNTLFKVINYIYFQFKISFQIIKLKSKVGKWIFFIGGDVLLLPILTARLLKIDAILLLSGSSTETHKCYLDNRLWTIFQFLSRITFFFVSKILVYSKSIIKLQKLEKYSSKISIAPRHKINLEIFNIKKTFKDRDSIIGFVGRLSEEKAPMNFLLSVSSIIKKNDDIRFLIIGNGKLKRKIIKYIRKKDLGEKIDVIDWVDHRTLSKYLNDMKLLIIPSHTEGLPNIMLESMACGTPVLANNVGAIPDIIINGKTGFLMENNTPENISRNVIEIIKKHDLEKISLNGKKFVENKFKFELILKNYESILIG